MSVTAAVHAKLLALRSSSLAKVTTGHVVNLASNDVQRLSEAFLYWTGLILGPAETIAALFLLTIVLGFAPAVSGLSCVLLLIPLEWLISKRRAKLRLNAAKLTDKRINLMSEIIAGNLAVKMLGWEDPLLEKVNGIRKEEHKMLKRLNYISGSTLVLYGCLQTIMVCVTFVVVRPINSATRTTELCLERSVGLLVHDSTLLMHYLLSAYSICHAPKCVLSLQLQCTLSVNY